MGTYRSAVLADNPVRYWKLDDSTGTDTQGNGNLTKGTTTAAPTTGVTGQSSIGTAWSFDGGDQATFTMPTLSTTASFEMFFKCTAATTKTSHTFMRFDGSSVGVIRMQASNVVYPGEIYGVFGSGGEFHTGTRYDDGNWHHLVVTLNGTTIKVYVDGVLKNNISTGASSYTFGATGYIGRDNAGTASEYLIGSLDEIAIYNTELSSTRVTAHYNDRAGTFDGYAAEVMTGSGTSPTVAFAGPERYETDLTTYNAAEWTFDAGITPSHASGKLTLTHTGTFGYAKWNKPADVGTNATALIRVKRTAGTGLTVVGWDGGSTQNVPSDGLWYWIRLQKSSGVTYSKIWENSQTEPVGLGDSGGDPGSTRGLRFGLDNDTLVVDYMAVDVLGNSIALPTLPAENVSVNADVATGSATAPNATVNIWAGVAAEPFLGTGEMLTPPVDLNYFHSPAFGSGEFGDHVFSADANAEVAVSVMSGEGNLLDPEEVDDAGDNYYLELLATVDTDDFWYRLDEQSGTVIHDALGDEAKDADLYGDYNFGVFGPESRRAMHFEDGYAKRRWATESSTVQGQSPIDDSDTDQFAFEVVLRTTDGNGIIAYGLDRANPMIETGPVPYFRNAIYLKDGKVTTNWNYAGRTDSAFELGGVTNVADGNWHHIVVAFNYGGINNLNSGLRIYIDGKLDIRRRRDIVPGLWASPDSYFGMPEAWRAVTPLYPWQKNLNADVMEVAFRYNDFLTHDDVIELYYAVFGIVPIRVTPAVGYGVMPDAVGKGNQLRALVLYTKWNAQGLFGRIGSERYSPSGLSDTLPDEFDHNIDLGRVYEPGESPWEELAGYRVVGVPIMREDYEVLAGPYRDPITDLPRLLDLQEDLDLDEYDIILFRNWPDEGADKEVFFQRGYTNDSINDFLASVKQAVVDGWGLEITNPALAYDLGLISGARAIPMLVDKTPDGETDVRGAVVNPWDADEIGSNYLDLHANNWHRVVATVPGITDSPEVTEIIDDEEVEVELYERIAEAWMTFNDGQDGQINNRWGYKLEAGDLQIGDEFISVTNWYTRLYAYLQENSISGIGTWDKYVWSVTPDGLRVGTPLYKFGSKMWVGDTEVDNPYKEYIGGAIVQPGDTWDGVRVAGKVFMNFAETPFNADTQIIMSRQIVPPNEELDNPNDHENAEQRTWDYSSTRVGYSSTFIGGPAQTRTFDNEMQERGVGYLVEQYVRKDGSIGYRAASASVDKALVGINIVEKYDTEPAVVPNWFYRAMGWLGTREEVPAGSVVIRPTAVTGSGVLVDPQTVAERSVSVSAEAALGLGVLVAPDEATEPDAIVHVFPATGSGTMTGSGKTITVAPFLGSGVMVDNFDLISASGEQVTLFLRRLNEVELYLLEGIK